MLKNYKKTTYRQPTQRRHSTHSQKFRIQFEDHRDANQRDRNNCEQCGVYCLKIFNLNQFLDHTKFLFYRN